MHVSPKATNPAQAGTSPRLSGLRHGVESNRFHCNVGDAWKSTTDVLAALSKLAKPTGILGSLLLMAVPLFLAAQNGTS
jgi:hypothetical protein